MERICVCGNQDHEAFTHSVCLVTGEGETVDCTSLESNLVRCTCCGVVRRGASPFANDEAFKQYYRAYPPTNVAYKAKDYAHDRMVAEARCRDYGINQSKKEHILDVGSGSGAFVDACRELEQEAFGCEIGVYHYEEHNDYIYRQRLEDINFPTDHFDLVTCHDVLEHVDDVKRLMAEMHRITKQLGRCIIEVPRFFHPSGGHHWKDKEHLWFFDEEQVKKLAEEAGFVVVNVVHPIETKVAAYCIKPVQHRPSVLLPPGIGDSYWSMTKMRGFLKAHGLGLPNVAVACTRDDKWGGHLRSVPFLEMFPFVRSVNDSVNIKGHCKEVWREAYAQQGRTVFEGVMGFDYFLSYNGHLRVGKPLENIDKQFGCEWYPPMFVSLEQERYRQQCVNQYGDYIAIYVPYYGTYEYWRREFAPEQMTDALNQMVKQTSCTPIFVGAGWDAEDRTNNDMMCRVKGAVNLQGKTSVEQVFGLMRGAKVVFGHPSGLTILSVVLGCNTLMLWNGYYNQRFWWRCCPPDAAGRNYFVETTYRLRSDKLADELTQLVKDGGIKDNTPQKVSKRAEPLESLKKRKTSPGSMKWIKNDDAPIASVRSEADIDETSPIVACVLKSGGDYDKEYVVRLKHMLDRNVSIKYRFAVLTDMDIPLHVCDYQLPISDGLHSWWPKVELFRDEVFAGSCRVTYMDLDVVIVDNIDDLLTLTGPIHGLRPWNGNNYRNGMMASGIMSWNNGEYSFLYERFSLPMTKLYRRGDQAYFSEMLHQGKAEFRYLQDVYDGVVSYKRECRSNGGELPQGTKIVCFHGKPRPRELISKVNWVAKHWR